MAEQVEREKRKQNLIVFALPSSSASEESERRKQDSDMCAKLFQAIGQSPRSIESVRRFSSKSESSPAPVLIKLASNINILDILASAKLLRNCSEFDKVYINADLTKAGRSLKSELRKQRDAKNKEEAENEQPFRWGIRGNEIKRFRVIDRGF